MTTLTIPASNRSEAIERAAAFLRGAVPGKVLEVIIKEKRKRRSDEQNRYLWGCVYPTIIKEKELRGWATKDVHEYFLGAIYGWETLEGLGRKKVRPARRSSKMTTVEFAEYVEHIQKIMAEQGIYIPSPNEV